MQKESMKKSDIGPQWNDTRCRLSVEEDSDGKLHIFGMYYHFDTPFRFSLRQQKSGKSVMRGTVSIISKRDGRIMQLEGRKKNEILKKLEETRSGYLADMQGKRIEELNLSTSVSTDSLDHDHVKAAIVRAVLRLYNEHAVQIQRESGEIARPETITPLTAVQMHVDDYLSKNHRTLGKEKYEQYKRNILSICFLLPHIPMADFTYSIMSKAISSAKVSQQKEQLLKKFWLFCIQSGICIGVLPFAEEKKRKPSPEVSIRNATRPSMLSLEDQDNSYNLIYPDPTGGDCGYALMAWGGFSAKDSCPLCWRDVIWCNGHTDYVRIRFSRPDLAGATHDYTAPIFPFGARILRKRYETLRLQYSEDELNNMPIVSQITDPTKAMSPDALVQHTTMRLRTIGLQYEAIRNLRQSEGTTIAVSRRLLKNTFLHNVYFLCALAEEEGTAKFLAKESLSNNTTDDYYTNFADEEAGERLFAYMSVVIPEETIPPVEENPKRLPNGHLRYTYSPDTTRQRIGHVGHYTLRPGEEIIIRCPHGVKGSVTTRGYNDDGTLRRKSKKKQYGITQG